MKKQIISREHGFDNKINHVARHAKTVSFSGEHSRTMYVYRTTEIDEAFQEENWSFFEKIDMAIIQETDSFFCKNPKPRIWYKIDTKGWKVKKSA